MRVLDLRGLVLLSPYPNATHCGKANKHARIEAEKNKKNDDNKGEKK